MRNWTIGKKLFGGVGVLILLLLATGGLAIAIAVTLKGELDVAARQTTRKIDLAHEIQEDVVRCRSEQRLALLAAFAKDPAAVTAAAARITTLLTDSSARLDEMTPLLVAERGRRAVAEIRALQARWRTVNDAVFAHIRRGEPDKAWDLERQQGSPLLDQIDGHGETLLQLQRQFLEASIDTAEIGYARARLTLIVCVVLSLVVGTFVVVVVRGINRSLRDTARDLRDGAEQVAAASAQVAGAAQSLSQGATEQAASLEETSASMEEMASMTRSNAERAGKAAALMTTVEAQLGSANAKLSEMVASMVDIRDSSGQVAKIIKTIDEIAFQTNILALNAAVEAARAGQAGMGFAVVADEVRNLAHRAAEAARGTASLIETSRLSADQGVARVEEVVEAIGRFSSSVGEVRSLSEQVSTASDQQRLGIGQVSQAVAQMEKVTQVTAGTAEESAAASEELSAQAEASLGVVRQLDVMVGVAAGAGSRARNGRRGGAGARIVLERARPHWTGNDVDVPSATGTFGPG